MRLITRLLIKSNLVSCSSFKLHDVGANPSAIWFGIPTLHLKEQFGNNKSSLLCSFKAFCSSVLLVST
jgi:hypothetical protein